MSETTWLLLQSSLASAPYFIFALGLPIVAGWWLGDWGGPDGTA